MVLSQINPLFIHTALSTQVTEINRNRASDKQPAQHGTLRCSWPVRTLQEEAMKWSRFCRFFIGAMRHHPAMHCKTSCRILICCLHIKRHFCLMCLMIFNYYSAAVQWNNPLSSYVWLKKVFSHLVSVVLYFEESLKHVSFVTPPSHFMCVCLVLFLIIKVKSVVIFYQRGESAWREYWDIHLWTLEV